MNSEDGVTSWTCVVHLRAADHSYFFTILKYFQYILEWVNWEWVDTTDVDCSANLHNFRFFATFIMRIYQISEFFIVDLKISYSYRCGKAIATILIFLPTKNILKTHLKQSFLRFLAFNWERFPWSCLTICENCGVIALIDLLQDLSSNIFKYFSVVDRRMTHRIICAVITTMESKFSGRIIRILGIFQSQLLVFHLDNIFEVALDLSGVEWSHSDHDLDGIWHACLSK